MIDHFGIIVKDIEASKAFYEAVLAPLGYAKTVDESYGVGFSNPDQTKHTGIFWLGQGEPSCHCTLLLLHRRGQQLMHSM